MGWGWEGVRGGRERELELGDFILFESQTAVKIYVRFFPQHLIAEFEMKYFNGKLLSASPSKCSKPTFGEDSASQML